MLIQNEFIGACLKGNIDKVRSLLELDGDRIMDGGIGNEPAFLFACFAGHLEIVKLLLELDGIIKINVHVDNELAFISACQFDHLEIVKLLLILKNDRQIQTQSYQYVLSKRKEYVYLFKPWKYNNTFSTYCSRFIRMLLIHLS